MEVIAGGRVGRSLDRPGGAVPALRQRRGVAPSRGRTAGSRAYRVRWAGDTGKDAAFDTHRTGCGLDRPRAAIPALCEGDINEIGVEKVADRGTQAGGWAGYVTQQR